MLKLLLTETGDPPRNSWQRLEKEFPPPLPPHHFFISWGNYACSCPSPQSMRRSLAPTWSRAGRGLLERSLTASLGALLSEQGCGQGQPGQRTQASVCSCALPRLLLYLGTLLLPPAGPGGGARSERRLRLTFASDYGRKQH